MSAQPVRKVVSSTMARSALKTRANKLIAVSLTPKLKEYGFGKRGDIYERAGSVVHLVDIQYSRWNDPSEVSFTLNCGVYIPGVTSVFRNLPEPKEPQPTDCCISVRIGMMTEARLDIWWKISTTDEPERESEIRKDIAAVVEEAALPFLDLFGDGHSVAEFLSGRSSDKYEFVEPRAKSLRLAYAAATWKMLAETERCRECLQEAVLAAKKTPLDEVVNAFAKRLGCV